MAHTTISNGDDLPDQPEPIECSKTRLNGVTAIARLWAPGDTARCRLCEVCTARGDLCVVGTTEQIPDEEMWLFSLRGSPADRLGAGSLRLASC